MPLPFDTRRSSARAAARRAVFLSLRPALGALLLASALAAGCSRADGRSAEQPSQADTARRDSVAAVLAGTPPAVDTGVPTPIAATLKHSALVRRRPPALSPAADSAAEQLVFVPRTQTWFIVAARGKRMLVDLGRADLDLRAAAGHREAYLEAVSKLSPLPEGARLALRGPWGLEEARVSGFDGWNGRIVATLAVSPTLDSLAHHREPLLGTAFRLPDSVATDSAPADSQPVVPAAATTANAPGTAHAPLQLPGTANAPATAAAPGDSVPPAPTCSRDSVPEALRTIGAYVRDSIELELRTTDMPPYDRMKQSVKVVTSYAPGCFGSLGQLAIIVSLRASANEWVRERMVVVNDSGAVTPLRESDYRFKGHDALYAFDADGDGVDDLAVRAVGERSGALTVLRLDPARKRAERVAGGFAWEAQ